LRFIGEVSEHVAADVDTELSTLQMDAFHINVEGIGVFGGLEQPHTLWAGIKKSDPLKRLRKSVETRVQWAGVAPDRRKFHPHITLARLRHAPMDRVHGVLSAFHQLACGPFLVGRVVLFSSMLGKNGSVYTKERTYPLWGGGMELLSRDHLDVYGAEDDADGIMGHEYAACLASR
jgi:2'-5' RNA ligase